MTTSTLEDVEILILGAGWTSNFLIPLLESRKIKHAATTTTGRDGTISFKFDPDSYDLNPYKVLPNAKTIMITFPLKGEGQSQKLVDSYRETHSATPGWIQLGSTGIYTEQKLTDHKSPYDKENIRAIAEDELLSLKDCKSTVLNLAGLYDDEIRRPRNWISRIAKSKDDVYAKTAVHLIHGADVARAVVAVHENFDKAQGQRWILTDSMYYDWWFMLLQWGGQLADGDDLRQTIGWCMEKGQVAQLPRYILRRAALRALSTPATSSTAFNSVSKASRSFVSVNPTSARTSNIRSRCLLPSLQLRFKTDDATAASQEGEDVKVVKEEVTETPQEIKEAVEESSAPASMESTSAPTDPEVTATEGKTMSQPESGEAADQTVAPEETTRDTHAATPSAPSMSEGGGIPSRSLGTTSGSDLEPNNVLYCGNLFFEVTDQALKRKFSEFGDVQTAKIIYDFRGLSKGFGYVTFNTVEEASKAREAMNQQEFHGRRMMVNYQANRNPPRSRPGQDGRQGQSNQPSKTLFVGNMSYEMSDKDLSDLFRQCVNVVDVRVAIDRNTGSPRGFAHADFTDVESAMAAKKQLLDKEVYGRKLKVDYSQSTPRSPSPRDGDRPRRSRAY